MGRSVTLRTTVGGGSFTVARGSATVTRPGPRKPPAARMTMGHGWCWGTAEEGQSVRGKAWLASVRTQKKRTPYAVAGLKAP